jgi:formate dehydrogenase accessory protein FdhD
VKTRAGVERHRGAHGQAAVVTTGCGQGTVFGDLMRPASTRIQLPPVEQARIRQSTLHRMLETMRQQDSIHRKAGSVHGCALFQGARLLMFVEDVGRHNAIDTIAGWMGLHGIDGGDKAFYTTGRLTSEMVMKAAQLGVPIVVSRNGVTAMGHGAGARLGMALFGRASEPPLPVLHRRRTLRLRARTAARRGASRLRLTGLASPTATGEPLDESPVSCRPGRQPLAACMARRGAPALEGRRDRC